MTKYFTSFFSNKNREQEYLRCAVENCKQIVLLLLFNIYRNNKSDMWKTYTSYTLCSKKAIYRVCVFRVWRWQCWCWWWWYYSEFFFFWFSSFLLSQNQVVMQTVFSCFTVSSFFFFLLFTISMQNFVTHGFQIEFSGSIPF